MLQIPPRSISSVVPRNGTHLSIDPFGRINTFEATPHKNRAKFDSGYRFSIRAENCVKGVNCEVQNRCVYWREYVARMVNVYPVRGEKENMCDSRVRASVCLFESDERDKR